MDYIFATKANRLMVSMEAIAVLCKNHTEHMNARTLCGAE
jgi:hypothetical protein